MAGSFEFVEPIVPLEARLTKWRRQLARMPFPIITCCSRLAMCKECSIDLVNRVRLSAAKKGNRTVSVRLQRSFLVTIVEFKSNSHGMPVTAEDLAFCCDCSVRSVRDCLAVLEKAQLIVVEKVGSAMNIILNYGELSVLFDRTI
jgi:hypothetical protein